MRRILIRALSTAGIFLLSVLTVFTFYAAADQQKANACLRVYPTVDNIRMMVTVCPQIRVTQ